MELQAKQRQIYNELLASLKTAVSGISGGKSASSSVIETGKQANTVDSRTNEKEKAIAVKEQRKILPSSSVNSTPAVDAPAKASRSSISMEKDQIIDIKIDVPKASAANTNKVQDVFQASRMKAEQSLRDLAKRKQADSKETRIVQTSSKGKSNGLSDNSKHTSTSVTKTKAVRPPVVDQVQNTAAANVLTNIKTDNVAKGKPEMIDVIPQTSRIHSVTRDIVSHESQKSSVVMNKPQTDFAHHSSEWKSIHENGPVRADHPRWMEHGHEIRNGQMFHGHDNDHHSTHHTQTVVGIPPQGISISHCYQFSKRLKLLSIIITTIPGAFAQMII
jgi:hypothetical protein